MRLYPDTYPLVLQVQQATTHAMRACSALAGAEPLNLGELPRAQGPPRQDHRLRQGLQAGPDRRHRGQDVTPKLDANERKFSGQGLLLQTHPAELLFPLHHGPTTSCGTAASSSTSATSWARR
jgi:hypothetical protein